MPKPKTIEDPVRISLVLPKKQADWVAHKARLISVEQNRTITASEAIRMAVEQVYPLSENQKRAEDE